jgi:hypothetical protein
MLAHDHSDFPSDLATILYAANAQLSIASSAGTQVVDIGTFLQMEMNGLVRAKEKEQEQDQEKEKEKEKAKAKESAKVKARRSRGNC